ncbi:tetratricopeptide repeat protein [Terasakiella sp. A23]|uniref:tetratricopeptide repeat protein n=1 Tax=Terasakiella sp. FCG-A23 TaxID=3080561 RepID=UPI002952E917|nr:tetratricopeptide repeat protein [Terasakiella sp. A23]MDV7341372.1 tetratricopeptide repeat protein [Terasakiella sp. A23]
MAKEEDASVSNLFKEIDDELRQDKATLLWKQYGSTVIGAIIAVIIAVGAYEGWKSYDLSQRSALGDQYAKALDLANEQNFAAATEAFQALAGQSDKGYNTLARLQEAGLLARQGKFEEAANAYFLIAQNGELNSSYRDMALILGGLNGLDVMEPNDIISRLAPMIGGVNAWRHSASEITAYAHAKAGDNAKAAEIMNSLSEDASAPAGVRQRAQQFAKAYAG